MKFVLFFILLITKFCLNNNQITTFIKIIIYYQIYIN